MFQGSEETDRDPTDIEMETTDDQLSETDKAILELTKQLEQRRELEIQEPDQEPANIEETIDNQLLPATIDDSETERVVLEPIKQLEQRRELEIEPDQEPANIEVEKTDDQQFSQAERVLMESRRELELRRGIPMCYPIVWVGDLFLRSYEARIMFKFIYGDTAIFKTAVPESKSAFPPGIRISRQEKYEDSKAYLKRIMQAKKGSCVLIADPLDEDGEEVVGLKNKERLRTQFIRILIARKIVGVSHFPQDAIPDKADSKKVAEISEKFSSMQVSDCKEKVETSEPVSKCENPKNIMRFYPLDEFIYQNLSIIAPEFTKVIKICRYTCLLAILDKYDFGNTSADGQGGKENEFLLL